METYEKRLEKEEWGELYNKEQLEQVINSIMTDQVFCWTEELLKISSEGDRMCEVGCVWAKCCILAETWKKCDRTGFLERVRRAG